MLVEVVEDEVDRLARILRRTSVRPRFSQRDLQIANRGLDIGELRQGFADRQLVLGFQLVAPTRFWPLTKGAS